MLEPSHRASVGRNFRNLVLRHPDSRDPISCLQLSENDGLDKQLRLQLSLKYMRQQDVIHAGQENESRRLDAGSIDLRDHGGQFAIGNFSINGTISKVLVEWRSYWQSSAEEEVNQELFERVKVVAHVMGLDKVLELCVLRCHGYFHNETKLAFGMVYGFPEPAATAQNCEMLSLQEIFINTQNKEHQPPLEHKYKLAFLLARAISEFHKVGWVHKNITSGNVVFFSNSTRPHGQRVAEPYLTGFHHCRPDEPSAFSEGISKSINEKYQHFKYLRDRERYISKYGYYSLSLVLLEIGY